jgi:hypothetical protein
MRRLYQLGGLVISRRIVMGTLVGEEVSTSDAAKLVGVKVDVLRKWKYRGFLKLAPPGVAGQGRGVECYWSPEAVAEAKAWAATHRINRDRKKRR